MPAWMAATGAVSERAGVGGEKIPSVGEFGQMTTSLPSTVGRSGWSQLSHANICSGIPKESEVSRHIRVN